MAGEIPKNSYPLCQPDPSKSCGACCGLYNWEDHTRATLESLLLRRTLLFPSLKGDPRHYQERCSAEAGSSNPKLLEAVHNCEFLGFLDENRKRVGCLLHPSANGGADLRNYCYYGAELCAGHLCPSYTHLTRVEQKAVLAALDDWYLYGLVITDIDLVKDFLHHAQNQLGESVDEKPLEDPAVRRALGDFFRLKESWRFSSSRDRLGKYFFSHSEYEIARIEYEKNWGMKPSRFHRILLSLSSEFRSREEIWEAESIVGEKIMDFSAAYERARKRMER